MIVRNSRFLTLVACVFLTVNNATTLDDIDFSEFFNNDEYTELEEDDEIKISLQRLIDEMRLVFEESGFDSDIFSAVNNNEELTDTVDFIQKFISCIEPNLKDERLSGKYDFINEKLKILKDYCVAFNEFHSENFKSMVTDFENSSKELDVAYKEELFQYGITEEFQNTLSYGSHLQICEFINKSLNFIDRLPESEKNKFDDYKEKFFLIKNGFYNVITTNTAADEANILAAAYELSEEIDIEEQSKQHIIEAFSNLKDNCRPSNKFQNRLLSAINPILIDNTKRLIKKLEKMEERFKNEFSQKDYDLEEEYTNCINRIHELQQNFIELAEKESVEKLNFVDTMLKVRSTISNCETVDELLKHADDVLQKHRIERINKLTISSSELIKVFYEKAKEVFGQEVSQLLASTNVHSTIQKNFDSISENGRILGKKINEQFISKLCNNIGLTEYDNEKYNLIVDYLLDSIDKANRQSNVPPKQNYIKEDFKTKHVANSIIKLFSNTKKEDKTFRKRDLIVHPRSVWNGASKRLKENNLRKRDAFAHPKKFWRAVLNKPQKEKESNSNAQKNTSAPQKMRKRDYLNPVKVYKHIKAKKANKH